MLILEIALGIVVGYFILATLPALLVMGGLVFLLGFGLILSLVVLWVLFDNPILLIIAALILIGFFIYKKFYSDLIKIKELEKKISARRKLGYDVSVDEEKFNKLNSEYIERKKKKIRFKSDAERRKALGYDN